MKKIIGLIAMFIYIFTASSLTHASTMGIFAMSNTPHQTLAHCHSDSNTSSSSNKQTHNMNCCELFNASKYFQVNLEFKTSLKTFQHTDINFSSSLTNIIKIPLAMKWRGVRGEGGQTAQGKYIRFSDLSSGIIVSLS